MPVASPPGFLIKLVRNRSAGVNPHTKGLVVHAQCGRNGLFGWFNNALSRASSTWWAGITGGREQYVDPDNDRAWCQAAGNYDYHSVETEGDPATPLTAAQVETVAQLFAWGHKRYGWPFQLAEKPGDMGLGWHGMGGTAWGGHPDCPGDARKAQRPAILARARVIADVPPPSQNVPAGAASLPHPSEVPGRRELVVGSAGPDVAFLQRWLGIKPDGVFGEQTRQAVQRYQSMRGLTADGVVGPKTWGPILSSIAKRAA